MQAVGWFSTPISCGALAGVGAGAMWVKMILHSIHSPPVNMMEFFSQNALRAALCLGVVLCAPAIYRRDVFLVLRAAAWSLLYWLTAMVFGYLAWVLAMAVTSGSPWSTIWRAYEVIYILMICPLLGGMTGYFLTRIYCLPTLKSRAIRFGTLGCALHLSFGLFASAGQALNLSLDTPEALALHAMFALMGYVFMGAVAGIPFDVHYRQLASLNDSREVVGG